MFYSSSCSCSIVSVWSSVQLTSHHLYSMTNFVLINLVSFLLLKVSLYSLAPLGPKCLNSFFFMPFLWNSNPYKERFRDISYKVKAADRLLCGSVLGSHYCLPGKLGYHCYLMMLFYMLELDAFSLRPIKSSTHPQT